MTSDWSLMLWASLPIPAFLLNEDDTIADITPAAEAFLNMSDRQLKGFPIWDKLMVDAPLEDAFERVRRDQSGLFINNVDVNGGNRPPVQCNIQIGPLTERPDMVLLL